MVNYSLKNKKIIKLLIIISVFSCMIIPYNSYASELQFNYTKEYLDWMKLSDEEKEKTVLPQMTSVSGKSIQKRK